jgi:hypothetical protein
MLWCIFALDEKVLDFPNHWLDVNVQRRNGQLWNPCKLEL